MVRNRILLLVVIVLTLGLQLIYAYRWPKENEEGVYGINATVGEYRGSVGSFGKHLHNGVDIQGDVGDYIYAIEGGKPIYGDIGTDLEFVRIGRFSYVHVKVLAKDTNKTYSKGEVIAVIKALDNYRPHLHLTESSTNPLRVTGLDNYKDNSKPVVLNDFKFYRNLTNDELTNTYKGLLVLNKEVDILARAYDRQNSPGSQNVGVYKIGYQVKNELGVLVIEPTYNIVFDNVPSDASLSLIYDTTKSTSSIYYYWVTNEMNANSCWNTSQSLDSSGNANSPDKAKYPDGKYIVSVMAKDIKGNGGDIEKSEGAASKEVILNNWTPQIKSLTTNATPDKPLKAGDTVEIKIEFTEQMNTGKTPMVQIWDAKASQWKSLSLSGTAWSNSSDGRIKDALLKASATLPDWGKTEQETTLLDSEVRGGKWDWF
jgi:hypothetical protein